MQRIFVTGLILAVLTGPAAASPHPSDPLREALMTRPAEAEYGAEAVVLFDSTTAQMVWNNGFRVSVTRHVRLKIFRPSGFSWSYVQIGLAGGDRLIRLDAATYNLEDSSVQVTRLTEKQIHTVKTNSFHRTVRFTFPNVKAGSVIEYSYSLLQQDIWEFHSTRFQRPVPVRQFVYHAVVPDFFSYAVYFTSNEHVRFDKLSQSGRYNGHNTPITHYFWQGEMIPAFAAEPLMPEGDQAMAGVNFSLLSVDYPGSQAYVAAPSFEVITEEFLDKSNTGKQLDDKLIFGAQVARICSGISDPAARLRAIYAWVQQHMQWNGYEQLWPDRPLNRAGREGTGTSAEINLMLVNMLRTAGITADPVILSTRSRGPIITRAAVVGKLNYVVCCATIRGKDYLLDATDKFRPPGMLPFKCLNDKGWVLSKSHGRWIALRNEEKYGISVFYDLKIRNDNTVQGKAYLTWTGYEAVDIRSRLKTEDQAGLPALLRAEGFRILRLDFENVDSLHLPLRAGLVIESEGRLPSLGEGCCIKPLISIYKPFDLMWITEERLTPMDFGCPRTLSVKGRIQLPDGLTASELPEPMQIRIPGKNISFVSGTGKTTDQISFTAELNLGEPTLSADEYPFLKAFLLQVNTKFNELVVCK